MRMRIALAAGLCLTIAAAGCGGAHSAGITGADAPTASRSGPGRGFPVDGPWVSLYGTARDVGRMAATFRIINIDADPTGGNVTAAQITRLKAGGRNRVLSYLNLGSVEKSRQYWSKVPKGFISPKKNKKAQLGSYAGYDDEIWMNPANAAWRNLILDYVAPRLAAQGVDGFYFDNLEVVEHGTATREGPCDRACSQGGLDLVAALRARYPNLLFVMQNATGARTLGGRAGGVPFPTLLDGVAHEETFTGYDGDGGDAKDVVYRVRTDQQTVKELNQWRRAGYRPGGRPFWIAVEDYVNSCANAKDAKVVYGRARAAGFSPYVSNKSASQETVCYRDFRTAGR